MRAPGISLVFAAALAPVVLGLASCGTDDAASVPGSSSGSTSSGSSSGGSSSGGSSSGSSSGGSSSSSGSPDAAPARVLKNVFVILMENHDWATVKASASAKYIKSTLVPDGAHAEQYKTPANLHPSEPNYIWLEAGDNLGITTDDDPGTNHRAEKEHLVTQLEAAGISWKAYAEDIDGKACPLTSSGLWATKHTPMLFFDDVTDTNSTSSKRCIEHVRPYSELAADLVANKAPRYSFITPNLCNDMHGEALGIKCQIGLTDLIKRGDDWLAAEIPKIQASAAYQDGGVIFVLWDEGDESLVSSSDGPMPMFVLSKYAKKGYTSTTSFNHSSTLRTIETIFGVPYLRGAKTSNDLSEMFTQFP